MVGCQDPAHTFVQGPSDKPRTNSRGGAEMQMQWRLDQPMAAARLDAR